MSAAVYLEAATVIDSARDPVVSRRFDEFIDAAELTIEPVTAEQARVARAAYRDFGRGSGHPARLNFGDCFSYALARVRSERLVATTQEFAATDLETIVP